MKAKLKDGWKPKWQRDMEKLQKVSRYQRPRPSQPVNQTNHIRHEASKLYKQAYDEKQRDREDS